MWGSDPRRPRPDGRPALADDFREVGSAVAGGRRLRGEARYGEDGGKDAFDRARPSTRKGLPVEDDGGSLGIVAAGATSRTASRTMRRSVRWSSSDPAPRG